MNDPYKMFRRAFAGAVMLATAGTATAGGLSYSFEPAARFHDMTGERVLFLRGEVAVGDLERLQAFLALHSAEFIAYGEKATFAVDGGDVVEAQRIGSMLRDAMVHAALPDIGSTRCVSACFFMFASAVSRAAVPGTLGFHRPHFKSEIFGAASAQAARTRYEQLLGEMQRDLRSLFVPENLIRKLFATPSDSIYWLSDTDLGQLGRLQPWFAEYAAARCGFIADMDVRVEEALAAGDVAGVEALGSQQSLAQTCLTQLRASQRRKLVDALRENGAGAK